MPPSCRELEFARTHRLHATGSARLTVGTQLELTADCRRQECPFRIGQLAWQFVVIDGNEFIGALSMGISGNNTAERKTR